MIARLITESDYDDVLRLTKEFYKDSAEKYGYKFEIDKFNNMFRLCCDGKDLKCFIAIKDNEAVGLACLGVFEAMFSYQRIAQELIWYVTPEHRGGKVALKLYKAIEKVGNEADIFTMVCLNTGDDRVDRFYQSQGYKLAEKHYIRS